MYPHLEGLSRGPCGPPSAALPQALGTQLIPDVGPGPPFRDRLSGPREDLSGPAGLPHSAEPLDLLVDLATHDEDESEEGEDGEDEGDGEGDHDVLLQDC